MTYVNSYAALNAALESGVRRLSSAEIHALRDEMAKASAWMTAELQRRRVNRGVLPKKAGTADTGLRQGAY